MRRNCIVFVVYFLLWGIGAQAQDLVLGRVVDATDGQPLLGAQILVEPSGKGTLSDNFGRFELQFAPTDSRLLIRYLGYGQKEFELGRGTIDLGTITLNRSDTTLDEVVVSASARNFKPDFVGSNFRIYPIAMKNINPLSTEEVLRTIPGVNIMVGHGAVQPPEHKHPWFMGKKIEKSVALGRRNPYGAGSLYCTGGLLQPGQ